MPTFSWAPEDAVEKFWANQPLHAEPSPPTYPCTVCGEVLPSPEALRQHFMLRHPLELPRLYLRNEALSSETVIRTPIQPDDIELIQSTRCEVQIDGSPWQALTPEELRVQLTAPKDSSWALRLINERAVDNS